MYSKISKEGLDLIKSYEGFSSKPYLCPGNKITIGYGHVIKTNENFTSITKEEAEELLIRDLRIAITSVNELVKTNLNINQFSALVSFTYNLGHGNLSQSTLLMKVNESKHLEVPAELVRWIFAGGKRLRGLLLRRLDESKLYLK